MPPPKRQRAAAILAEGARCPVAVVGDFMLDRYLIGEATRISPEAPVPVLRYRNETARPGGAGNVAANLTAFGVPVRAIGVLGEDDEADSLRCLLEAIGVGTSGLLRTSGRPTTVKTRLLAGHHPVARIDREEDHPLAAAAATALFERFTAALSECGAVVMCDYDKGVLNPGTVPALLEAAAARRLPVFVDPKPPQFSLYRGVRLATPNHQEACAAAGWTRAAGDRDPEGLSARLQEMLDGAALLITRGRRGLLWREAGGPPHEVKADAREVYDVTGAGDTVIAVAALALIGGGTMDEAAEMANRAAALVVGRVGTSAPAASELLERMA